MPPKNILALLEGGHRRMIGRSNQVAAMVSKDATLFPELVAGLWSEDPLVRMRAADAAEKITRKNQQLLQPYKRDLLELMAETPLQPELRWHLAVMIPRIPLTPKELRLAVSLLNSYIEDRSSIVKTSALQGLYELSCRHPSLRPGVIGLLRESTRHGTPAMKARSRILLLQCEGQ